MTIQRSKYKELTRPIAFGIQRGFRYFPHEICLISGAPRSGTSAISEWLGNQRAISAFPESRILIAAHKFVEEAFRFKNLEGDTERILKLARHLVFDYYSDSRILLNKKLIVDKEPLEPIAFPLKEYEKFILNVKNILPQLRLLYTIRDPLATIWSMSQRVWGESLTTPQSRRFTLEEHIENWCSCADLALQLSSDPNTYIVQFGRLISDPENESEKIYEFLHVHNGVSFQPRQTHKVGFGEAEREKILQGVLPHIAKLKLRGITDLV